MANRVNVPNLVLAQHVLNKMATAANHYVEDETGEALVGVVVPAATPDDKPTVYVLETIAPDESAERDTYAFKQGDERQDELIWGFDSNWNVQREKQRDGDGKPQAARWNVPNRMWLCDSRTMTADRVGDGSSCRSRSSPVSISDRIRQVGTPRLSSMAAASASRAPPFSVSRPSA